MEQIAFTKNLIKGKIAEIIFETMFRNTHRFQLIHFGYEHTLPQLTTSNIHKPTNQKTLNSIKDTPDFIEVDEQNHLTLVEVKFRSNFYPQKILLLAHKLKQKWPEAWLFVATPDSFKFDSVTNVIKQNGEMASLASELVSADTQKAYLNLLNHFLPHTSS